MIPWRDGNRIVTGGACALINWRDGVPRPRDALGSWIRGWESHGNIWQREHHLSGWWFQGGAPKIAKLVITPITMVCGTYNYTYWGL